MTSVVSEKLEELRQDHRNMWRLLDLLEAQAAHIEECDEPDFDLAHDVLRYMTSYPDTVHHPKEDRIYARLKALRPELAGSGVAKVTAEHKEIAQLGVDLRDALAAIESGSVMRRDALVAKARQYVTRLREHIVWEERRLFSLADELLATQDWAAIDDGEHPDPLFGPSVEHSFDELLQRIAAYQEQGSNGFDQK